MTSEGLGVVTQAQCYDVITQPPPLQEVADKTHGFGKLLLSRPSPALRSRDPALINCHVLIGGL